MKKSIKLGLGALAVMGLMTTSLFIGSQSNAATTVTVTLAPLAGGNSCTLDNYTINGTVSLSAQTLSGTKNIMCNLYSSGAGNITVQASTISTPIQIAASSIKLTMSNTKTGGSATISSGAIPSVSNKALNTPATIFTKNINQIGTFSGSAKISVDFPAGAPDGSYVSTLTIDVPN